MLATALASVALLPGLLTGPVADVKQDTKLPILLPSTFDNRGETLYGSGQGSARRYEFFLSTERDCQANFCSAAWFWASKGGKPYGARSVSLARGRKGKFSPMSCGASCSPASIVWKERGVLYEIQTGKSKKVLVRLANSAIRKGPR
jgi:hypothetical protein